MVDLVYELQCEELHAKGGSMILPVLLSAHADRRRLIRPSYLSLFWSLSYQRGSSRAPVRVYIIPVHEHKHNTMQTQTQNSDRGRAIASTFAPSLQSTRSNCRGTPTRLPPRTPRAQAVPVYHTLPKLQVLRCRQTKHRSQPRP